jgi:hypothetical protein
MLEHPTGDVNHGSLRKGSSIMAHKGNIGDDSSGRTEANPLPPLRKTGIRETVEAFPDYTIQHQPMADRRFALFHGLPTTVMGDLPSHHGHGPSSGPWGHSRAIGSSALHRVLCIAWGDHQSGRADPPLNWGCRRNRRKIYGRPFRQASPSHMATTSLTTRGEFRRLT